MRFTQQRAILLGVLVIILLCTQDKRVQLPALAAIVLLMFKDAIRRRGNTFSVSLIATDAVNESLVLDCRLAGRPCLFMIDTGYAGPPVLSASYLSSGETRGSVSERYRSAVSRLQNGVSTDQQNAAIEQFINTSQCLAYTSGCTMRLMGIGSTNEQQADMLMCDMLEMKTPSGFYGIPKRSTSNALADVFVTNPLPSSIHILTCDFLLHSSPALLSLEQGKLILNMSLQEEMYWRTRMRLHPIVLSGGSFVVDIKVGGASMRCTVDTGAPGPVCISAAAAKRITHRCRREKLTLRQSGVNGEQICSEIVRATVELSDNTFEDAVVFVNDSDIDQVDGYVGLGVLRAFDILLTLSGIGFQRNSHAIRSFESYVSVANESTCANIDLPCAAGS